MNGQSLSKLIETFAYNERTSQVDLSDGECSLCRDQREIEFTTERDDGTILGIEIRAATTAKKEAFGHLVWFRDHIASEQRFGILLHAGEHAGSIGTILWTAPFGHL